MTKGFWKAAAAVARVAVPAALVVLVLVPIAGRAAGWRWVRVVSASMEPGLQVGAVVLIRPAAGEDVAVGDVIAFSDPTNPRRQVLHRVTNRIGDGPAAALETKGDANPAPDSYPVPIEFVTGEVAAAAPPALLIRAVSLVLMAVAMRGLAQDERKRRQGRRAGSPGPARSTTA